MTEHPAKATLAEIHAANELAMQVWRQDDAVCADYLRDRGLDLVGIVAAGFAVGQARGDGVVCSALASHGFPLRVALAAGLIRANSRGDFVDVFRDRFMFPVRNVHDGSIAGFTGRALPWAHESAPRWLNSRTTLAFRKGELLYGLWEARRAIEERRRRLMALVVCEGPMDVIAVSLKCPAVAVAPAGTALTEVQAQWIADLATAADLPIVIAYDGDEAGERASAKCLSLIASRSLRARVSVASLPQGEDPASLASTGAEDVCTYLQL